MWKHLLPPYIPLSGQRAGNFTDLPDLLTSLLFLLPAAGKVFQPGLAVIPGSWCGKSAHFHPKSHGGSANDLA